MLITVNEKKRRLDVPLPLTTPKGKVRVKRRNIFHEYGLPHSTKRNNFAANNYIEWQIGYDLLSSRDDLREKTTLPEIQFLSDKGKEKTFYELSEYLYYFSRWRMITKSDIRRELTILDGYKPFQLLDKHERCQISRSHPVQENINGMEFLSMAIKYPQLVYQVNQYEVIAEVTVREKQLAVGVQPMLYFCIPIHEVRPQSPLHQLIGRTAETKEVGYFRLDEGNFQSILRVIRVFGMLSESHRDDMKKILTTTLRSLRR